MPLLGVYELSVPRLGRIFGLSQSELISIYFYKLYNVIRFLQNIITASLYH
jgi:hypothetical protein